MQIIRPIQSDDFDALKQIAIDSGHGFTSLPVNDAFLSEKIEKADASFQKQVTEHNQENYLFVLEDSTSGKVIGTTGINAAIGMTTPVYHYRQAQTKLRSTRLNLTNTVDTLKICNDYTGSSEICTLFLSAEHRKGYAGRLLSRVRFLFMAEHPHRFSDTIIAEMRGVSDEQGKSPFCQWLQQHFIDLDFPTIDYLMGIGDTDFIEQLMPKHPIYTSLLSEDAKAVIGKVHQKTAPALRMLEKEGFKFRGYVDLFDAGPTVESKLSEIKTVKQSHQGAVNIDAVDNEITYAVCNQKVADFRATFTTGLLHDEDSGSITLSPEVASALQVTAGESVRFTQL
jgi:arginine N-succinyltransferase